MLGSAPLCVSCKRLRDYDHDRISCDAFPEGIPDEIIFNEVSHKNPVDGDNGLRYSNGEPKEFDENG